MSAVRDDGTDVIVVIP